MNVKRIRRLAAPVLLASVLLAGCSLGAGNKNAEGGTGKIRVMYYDERGFQQQYGMLFSALNPNIEIEVASTSGIQRKEGDDYKKLMKDWIDKEKPDILMLDANQYAELAGEGKLLDLDTRVNRKDFDVQGLVPGLVDYLKEKGGGKLFGLTPSYYSQAVYYNKDLFDKYGIEYPKDKMTWNELLTLAARFPTDGTKENRVYGLRMGYQTNLFQLGNMIGMTEGLKYIDPGSMQVMINSDGWKKVFNTALKSLKSGSLYADDPSSMNRSFDSYNEYLLQDPFVAGKVAMSIDGNNLAGQIKQAVAAVPDKAVKNWDLVTMPVNPQTPDVGTGMSFYQIFAIDAKSPNADAAWKFLSYIHSGEFARVTSKTEMGGMPVRTKYFKDDSGHRFEAFYALKPGRNDPYKDYDKLPQSFFMQWDGLANEELKSAADGKKSIEEALDSLQTKAQAALMKAKDDARKGGSSGGGSVTTESSSTTITSSAAG